MRVKFRFAVGDTVWVRDVGHCNTKYGFRVSGYRIIQAVVQELHPHEGRAPWYPQGEGYAFNYRGVGDDPGFVEGGLMWDCYPGCRVYGSREEAIAARLPKNDIEAYTLQHKLFPG